MNTIVCLQVHLPNEQNVYFTEHNMKAVAEKEATRDTNLTAWLKLNEEDEVARNCLYANSIMFLTTKAVNGNLDKEEQKPLLGVCTL